jgi:hypothetical protein
MDLDRGSDDLWGEVLGIHKSFLASFAAVLCELCGQELLQENQEDLNRKGR